MTRANIHPPCAIRESIFYSWKQDHFEYTMSVTTENKILLKIDASARKVMSPRKFRVYAECDRSCYANDGGGGGGGKVKVVRGREINWAAKHI